MRDLDQRAERTRDDIAQSAVSIERLTLELEKPSAYSETLKSLNRRLDEVSTELLGAVKAEDVIADSNAIEREDAEPGAAPKEASRQDLDARPQPVHDQKAVATFERHARKLVEQYGQGIEPGKADLLVAVKMAQEVGPRVKSLTECDSPALGLLRFEDPSCCRMRGESRSRRSTQLLRAGPLRCSTGSQEE